LELEHGGAKMDDFAGEGRVDDEYAFGATETKLRRWETNAQVSIKSVLKRKRAEKTNLVSTRSDPVLLPFRPPRRQNLLNLAR
jgi:hypothetical protein